MYLDKKLDYYTASAAMRKYLEIILQKVLLFLL